jgi:hypothetical protein
VDNWDELSTAAQTPIAISFVPSKTKPVFSFEVQHADKCTQDVIDFDTGQGKTKVFDIFELTLPSRLPVDSYLKNFLVKRAREPRIKQVLIARAVTKVAMGRV